MSELRDCIGGRVIGSRQYHAFYNSERDGVAQPTVNLILKLLREGHNVRVHVRVGDHQYLRR